MELLRQKNNFIDQLLIATNSNYLWVRFDDMARLVIWYCHWLVMEGRLEEEGSGEIGSMNLLNLFWYLLQRHNFSVFTGYEKSVIHSFLLKSDNTIRA